MLPLSVILKVDVPNVQNNYTLNYVAVKWYFKGLMEVN